MSPARTRIDSHDDGLLSRSHGFSRQANRLILCFDGTGNVFTGTPGDTNIVKLYNMFDRSNLGQMHYYQPGIGTYPAEGPVNVNFFRSLMRKIEAILDQALATSFDSHVIAGYKFIMRYYRPGDRIYVFGFSRGAFTARFLARMISHVGLLSMGNDELVPFAYKVYQEYEQNRDNKTEEHTRFMNAFKANFCRTEREAAINGGAKISENESGIKVHFLGLFDCVSSVGNLDVPFFQKQPPPLPACTGTATHVRHAVAVDERRVKFKAALFSQEKDNPAEDIKEVWFPGNHGDVGGGWDVPAKEDGSARNDTSEDYFQLSDIALKWMVDELDDVEAEQFKDVEDRLSWDTATKQSFLNRFQKHKSQMITARLHDTMKFDMGSKNLFSIGLWNFMELLPGVIKRWEYVEKPRGSKKYEWDYIGWPPNFGNTRDIPSTALFHHSVLLRMQLNPDPNNYRPHFYRPSNSLWVKAVVPDAAADEPVVERVLNEVAVQRSPTNGDGSVHADNQRLLAGKTRIAFDQDQEATTSTRDVDEDGKPLVDGHDWDCIYRVRFADG